MSPNQTSTFYLSSNPLISEYKWATITCFLLGKMIIAVCFTGAVTYVMELFPTSARGCLLGVGAFASRLGSMLAPLTPLLVSHVTALASVLLATSDNNWIERALF